MLSGLQIKKEIEQGNIYIENFKELTLNPNSVNLTLNDKLYVYTEMPLDIKLDNPTKEIVIPSSGYLLEPNILYIASVNEYVSTRPTINLTSQIDGRSSIGRLGIKTHITAGFGDVGFSGKYTLEIEVTHPTIVYPNIDIAQVYFTRVEGELTSYNGKYQNQNGAICSKMYEDFN